MSEQPIEIRGAEDLNRILDDLLDADYLQTLDRSRPYDGQPHTDLGERGRQEVSGITMRDLRDCFIRACYDSSGLSPENYPRDVYGLPWDEMDPIAISQNLTCWVERYMGIFPNVPSLREARHD